MYASAALEMFKSAPARERVRKLWVDGWISELGIHALQADFLNAQVAALTRSDPLVHRQFGRFQPTMSGGSFHSGFLSAVISAAAAPAISEIGEGSKDFTSRTARVMAAAAIGGYYLRNCRRKI